MPKDAGVALRDTNPTGVEVQLARRTLVHMVSHPLEVVRRTQGKLVNMWRPTFAEASRRNALMLGAPYVALMLLSMAGAVLALRLRIPAPALYATLAVFLSVHIVFRGEIRNRQYVTPLLYTFAGLAISRLSTIRTRRA
jgi:uncharacterized membrane protein AbrB (regulator of aidB expression)